jgi:hypothetical protein
MSGERQPSPGFRTLTDIGHGASGFITGMAATRSMYHHAGIITIGFALYQFLDYLTGEEKAEVVGDIKEFLGGFVGAIVVYTATLLGLSI